MSTRSATHYELIGISREATPEEIKSAFRAQAQIHHPDAGGDTETFAAISAANDVLSDPDRRANYDATLPPTGAARFSGWARPAGERPDPAQETSTGDEAPRRRPVSEVEGDDPAVFRRTGDSRSFRQEPIAEEARGDMSLGAVDGGDLRTVPEVPLDEPTDSSLAPRGTDELVRPSRREGRWTFFGRRGDDEQHDEESTRRDSRTPGGRDDQSTDRSQTARGRDDDGRSSLNQDNGWTSEQAAAERDGWMSEQAAAERDGWASGRAAPEPEGWAQDEVTPARDGWASRKADSKPKSWALDDALPARDGWASGKADSEPRGWASRKADREPKSWAPTEATQEREGWAGRKPDRERRGWSSSKPDRESDGWASGRADRDPDDWRRRRR